jgi:hypothetical protein
MEDLTIHSGNGCILYTPTGRCTLNFAHRIAVSIEVARWAASISIRGKLAWAQATMLS